MRIADREIGAGWPPYVIAEIGVNHDGSVERALELVDAAADAGADAVKTQLFSASLLLSRAARLALYQAAAGETDPVAMLERLELPVEAMSAVFARARSRGLHAIVTVFSLPLVEAVESLGVDAYKAASPDIVNRPLLRALCGTGRPLIVSTGAATMDEVRQAAGWLEGAREARRLAMLHCVSAYPTPLECAALAGIRAIGSVLPGVAVGYSDHTDGAESAAYAVAAGATILEKHLTHDRGAAGPDHAASLEPDGFAAYVGHARRAWAMMGSGKGVTAIEGEVRALSRQSLVAARAVRAGEMLDAGSLAIKRPGGGLGPWMLDEVIGQHAARDLEADMPIVPADIAWSSGGALAGDGEAEASRSRAA